MITGASATRWNVGGQHQRHGFHAENAGFTRKNDGFTGLYREMLKNGGSFISLKMMV